MSEEDSGRARRRRPRTLSRTSLERSALHYLSQRDASRAQLKAALDRKVRRAPEDQDRDELAGWIEEVLGKMERLGYLDDARYAKLKTRALHRRGASARKIGGKLREKGIATKLIEEHTRSAREHDLAAALRLLRRKRQGPFSRVEVDTLDRDERHRLQRRTLGALARAGFGYELSRRAMDMGLDAAEALLAEDEFGES